MSVAPRSWFRPAEPAFAAVATAVALAAFFGSWILLHHGFYTREQVVDTPVYKRYGDAIAEGRIPYRDFRPEYPPAALPAFALPSVVQEQRSEFDRYRRIFEASMALCGAVALLFMAITLARLGAGPARLAGALGFAALAPLALGSVVLSRFDLWPAALTAGALAAFVSGRQRLGSGALGLAVAAKIYPGVLLPLAAVWVSRRYGRREALVCVGVFGAVLAVCVLPFVVVAPEGVAASLARQLSRPLQVESLGSALLLAVDRVADIGLQMQSSHGSQNIGGTPGAVVGWVQTVVQAGAVLGVWALFARGEMTAERLVHFSAASVLAFVALGKVLSPQFLIWLVPLVPLVCGRRGLAASALLGLALVLTQFWFPFRYWDFALTFDETVSWVVLVRDLVLLAALTVLVWPRERTA